MPSPYPCTAASLICCVIQIIREEILFWLPAMSVLQMDLLKVIPRLRCLTLKFKSPKCIIFFHNVAPTTWGATNKSCPYTVSFLKMLKSVTYRVI